MHSVINKSSNTIQDNKNTFVRLIVIYNFILHLIGIIPTDRRPYRRHALLSDPSITFYISSRMLCRPSEKALCTNWMNRIVGLLQLYILMTQSLPWRAKSNPTIITLIDA